MAKFAVILSGCGVFDGAEIHESSLTLLALAKYGIEYDIYAPDIEQVHVVNHITGEEMAQKRNVLIESARIARGNIANLDSLNTKAYDGIVFPGGFGVAKNLCSYAFDGIDMKVLPKIEEIVNEAYKEKIPIGGICISPMMLAKILGKGRMTIGNCMATGKQLEDLEVDFTPLDSVDVCIDEEHKLVTVPAYMNDVSILDVFTGIEKLVKAMISIG